MFEQYSYKTKFLALLCIFGMLSAAAYKRSFKTLIEVVKENHTLSEKTADISRKSKDSEKLALHIANLDKALGKEGVTKERIQQGIVGFATANHPGVSIHDLQPIHLYAYENYNIISNQLDLTGNANNLLRLGYDFEKQFDASRITSMNFYTTKKNNQSELLHLKIIFQNYENIP